MTRTSKPATHNPIIFSIHIFSIAFSVMDQLLLNKDQHVTCCRPDMFKEGNVLGHVLHCLSCTGVQVSLEDAEVLLGTAERTTIAGQATYVPYKVQPVNMVT